MISLLLLACTGPEPVVDDTGWNEPACPSTVYVESEGTVASTDINEASGVVYGRASEVLWTHNDSGDSARLFAVGRDGSDVGTWQLPDAMAFDWEDIAWATDEGGSPMLLAGDLGDNNRVRQTVTVYAAEEPATPAGGGALVSETWVYEYPDGAHDAESLLYDPIDEAVYILSKSIDGHEQLFRGEIGGGDMTEETTIAFGSAPLDGSGTPTAADISADGTWIVVVTYTHAWLWPRDPSRPLADAFGIDPCEVPREPEVQGEAVALLPDGSGYVTISEGENPDVWTYTLEP